MSLEPEIGDRLAEEMAREGDGDFRFAHAGGAEEEEAAARTALRREAEFAALQDGSDARDDVILPADLRGEVCFEVAEMFETVG